MKLPKRVRVGWRWFRVMRMPAAESQTDERFGECDRFAATIKVSTHFGSAKAAHTFLHEVLHAVWFERGLGDKPCEEMAVTELASGLCSFAKDNPHVVQEWLNTMGEDR